MIILNNQVERIFENMKPYFVLQPKIKINSDTYQVDILKVLITERWDLLYLKYDF